MQVSYSKQLIDSVTKTIYERGVEYFKKGSVFDLKIEETRTEADVEGTRQDYFVELEYDSDGFMGDCDCPYMENNHDDYCKHIVAVAIAHDKKLGLALPTSEDLNDLTIEEFPHLGKKLNDAFKDPLKADLEAIAKATDFSSWLRKHAKIEVVSYILPVNEVSVQSVKKAFRKIGSLGNKYKYDPYFCAGEVTAVASKTLDSILDTLDKLSSEVQMEIFHESIRFYYEIYLNMIDGSDGVWQIVQARVKKMFQIVKKNCAAAEIGELRDRINKEINGWGDVFKDLGLE